MLKKRLNFCADQVKKNLIEWLLGGGMGFNKEQDAIGNEVLFSSNRRRADLLILSKHFHALEIKGELDRLDKLECQIQDYCRVFDKVSVVLTPKYQIEEVRRLLPDSVGIILINGDKKSVIKKANINSKLDKAELLKFIPKSSLIKLLPGKSHLYTDELRHEIACLLSVKKIHQEAYRYLREVHKKLFRMFVNDTEGYPFFIDDIRGLSVSLATPSRYESMFGV